MHETIELAGKPWEVHLTSRAGEAVDRRVAPLVVEMRVQLGCLISERIVFTDGGLDAEADWLTPMLALRFRALAMKTCSAEDLSAGVPLEDYRFGGKGLVSPRRLQFDYQAGGWVGGWVSSDWSPHGVECMAGCGDRWSHPHFRRPYWPWRRGIDGIGRPGTSYEWIQDNTASEGVNPCTRLKAL